MSSDFANLRFFCCLLACLCFVSSSVFGASMIHFASELALADSKNPELEILDAATTHKGNHLHHGTAQAAEHVEQMPDDAVVASAPSLHQHHSCCANADSDCVSSSHCATCCAVSLVKSACKLCPTILTSNLAVDLHNLQVDQLMPDIPFKPPRS